MTSEARSGQVRPGQSSAELAQVCTMNPRDSVELMETQPSTLEGELLKDVPGKGKEEEGEEDDKTPGSFDCSVCGRGFPFLSSLSQHMRRHTGARPYKCPYCDHRASQKGNLKVHIRSHKLGTLTSHHPEEDEEGAEEEEEASQAEVGVPEGLDGGTSPTKSSSACNRVVNGEAGAAEEGRRKVAVRSVKREKAGAEPRPYCCRLCGYEALREDQLLSHIEKAHITADGDEEAAPAAREEEVEAEAPRGDGSYPCETCGQVFTQAWFLKSHMKKHAGLLEHCCRVCGRRFREAWFLKSHMKTHTSAKSKSRPKVDSTLEPPVTINDVAQDPEAVALSLYQICSKCGNMFHSRESLRAHEKVHGQSCSRRPHGQLADHEDSPAPKRLLLDYLNLRPAEEEPQEERERAVEGHESKVRMGFRIPELDPVCSYQAWQLATRGRVVEPVEPSVKGSSGALVGEEALAGAAVVFEKESSRYVLKGQEKRGAARRTGSHSSAGERTPESLSDSEYRPSSRQERRRPSQTSSKANECFECGKVFRSRHQMIVHQRVHRRDGGRGTAAERERPARGERWGSTSDPDSGSPSRPSTPGYGDSPPDSSQGEQASEMGKANSGNPADEKPYLCSLCDFVSADSSAFLTHVRLRHTAERDGRSGSTPSPSSDRGTPGTYPKLKRALLHGAAPYPYLAARTKRPTQPASPPDPSLEALDLCVRAEGHRGPAASEAVDKKGLSSHKCSFCSHSTCYPEVLWMHQIVAHRINSGSSPLAPKWALKNGLTKGPKDSHSKRRTGPPPALEGKACPPLPSLVRTPRTRPPPSSNEAQKKSRAAGNPGTSSASSSSATLSSRGSSTSTSGPTATRPPPRSGSSSSSSRPKGDVVKENQGLPSRSRPKTEKYPQSGSASSFPHGSLEKSSGALQRPAAPSPGSAASARLADRYTLPQEGLGFMLSSKHGLAEYSRARSSPQASQPKTGSPHSHGSGQGRMSRANRPSPMAHSATVGQGYGTSQAHGGSHHSSGSSSSSSSSSSSVKQESQAEMAEMPVDILSFLKNYNPHELAALYHRWGSANPLMDPTGMLRALMRQGEFVCHECGKSFSQPSHLRTHMRSHTAGFDFNGLHRGTEGHATSSTEAPKQERDRSAATSARTEHLRKGT